MLGDRAVKRLLRLVLFPFQEFYFHVNSKRDFFGAVCVLMQEFYDSCIARTNGSEGTKILK